MTDLLDGLIRDLARSEHAVADFELHQLAQLREPRQPRSAHTSVGEVEAA